MAGTLKASNPVHALDNMGFASLPLLAVQVDAAKELALYSQSGMQVAIYRYETQWLPLLAKHAAQKQIAPPLDVAWTWLMHALAPSKYQADFQDITGAPALTVQANSPQHRSLEAVANVSRDYTLTQLPSHTIPYFSCACL